MGLGVSTVLADDHPVSLGERNMRSATLFRTPVMIAIQFSGPPCT
jgi:hypothetical protein